jgi:RNA methyltransferase, TrmH family
MQGGRMSREPLLITSLHNPRVKQAILLREKRDRDKTNLFLIEGYRELLRAIDAKWTVETLFFCPSLFLGSNENALMQRALQQGAQLLECSDEVFHKLSYRDRPDGLLAIAKQIHLTLNDLDSTFANNPYPLFIIAESIEKPGNLGTILRSSDAVGVDGLIVCDRCTDIYNPNVVRASIGTLFSVPVVETSSQEAFQWLKEHQVTILAATPSAVSEYTDVDMCKPLAIAVGTEQLGLTDLWMKQAEIQVRIPMCGIADSLNVAMATTLLMYEALRQRRAHR